MFTRKQYMSNECTHEQYYAQFVTPAVIAAVVRSIGQERIAASKDPHMNDIPLKRWDAIIGYSDQSALRPQQNVSNTLGVAAALRAAGDNVSAGTLVCVMKAAARAYKARL